MRKATGFTLLELMIVLTVIGVLVGLALPSYQDSVRKGRRADAQSKLREFEVCAARVFTVDSDFANVSSRCKPPNDAYYTYAVAVGDSPPTYTVTATPQGAQAAEKCGTMTLTQTGATTPSLVGCWQQ